MANERNCHEQVARLTLLGYDIREVIAAKEHAEDEAKWLRRVCVAMLKHTAPGLKITRAACRPVRDMIEHPNGHVKRVLQSGGQNWIEALEDLYEKGK